MRALAHSHTRSFDAAAIARRPARRQPGKLQARPYFVLSCCFSTRRKEMSEQTRHATPNLLISIHILWLLISSLLHSLSTRLPPLAALRFTSLTTTVFSISLSFFIFYPLPFSFSAILFFASPQFASYPSSRLLFSFFLPASAPASSFLYTFLPLFSIYLLIFSLNSISCRRKNPRDFFSLAFLPLSKSSRDTLVSLAETSSAPQASFSFKRFAFRLFSCSAITKFHPERRQPAHCWYCERSC